ncbi:unnamed protein product [Scytosiphon promiscuus]
MAQKRRPSYLDYGKDDGDALNRSWDVESRYRLQENALGLPDDGEESNSGAERLFRAQVELGLHELTAAMSSLSRRVDKLENNTVPPEREKLDASVKELARNARCLSQALTAGIASARTRRRALHGFFHESDEQRAGCGDRVDPAARALIVEGLSFLAGKVRVETAWGSNANGGGLALSRSNASNGSSSSYRPRPKSPSRSHRGNGAAMRDSEQGVEIAAANFDGDGDGGEAGGAGSAPLSVRELSRPGASEQKGRLSPGKLEVEHLGSLGPSLPPSPINVGASVDGRMFPPAPVPKGINGIGFGNGVVDGARDRRYSEFSELAQSGGRKGREKPRPSTCANGRSNGGGGAQHSSSHDMVRGSSSPIATDARNAAADAGEDKRRLSVSKAGAVDRLSRSAGLSGFDGTAEASRASVSGVAQMLASAGSAAAISGRHGGQSSTNTRLRNKKAAELVSAARAARTTASSVSSAAERFGGASDRDLMARMLLDAAGAAAEAEERAGGPGTPQAGEGLAGRHISGGGSGYRASVGVLGARDGDAEESFGREVEGVRALSSRAAAVVGEPGANKAGCDKPGEETRFGNGPRASSAQTRRRRSTLDILHGENTIQGGGRRLSLNSEVWPSQGAGNGVPVVDAQGFVDLGAASAGGEGWARLAKQAKRPESLDPGVAELEAKLQELRRIGNKIKEQAAASTAEPSLTIPAQDLAALSPWFQHARSGNSAPASLRTPSSSRRRQLGTAARYGGRARGSAIAAAGPSAFTSAGPSPSRPGEDPPSTTAVRPPPMPPRDNTGVQPALSLPPAPSFSSAALREDVVSSLERHLAEYRAHAKGGGTVLHPCEEVGGSGGNDGGAVTAGDVGDKRSRRGCRNGDDHEDTSHSARPEIVVVSSTAVEVPESSEVAQNAAGPSPSRSEEPKGAVVEKETAAGIPSEKENGPEEKEESAHATTSGEAETSAAGVAKKTTSWAQEYHEYLCSKEA